MKPRFRGSKAPRGLAALAYASRWWEAIDTPTSLGCYLRAKHGEYAQLVGMSVSPGNYLNHLDFMLDYQAVKLLSKYPYLDTGIDREAVASRKFIDAERMCLSTNERFRARADGRFKFDDRVESVILRAQRKIVRILGDVPKLDDLDFAFGPGAAYGVRGETSVYNKVTSTLECTYAFVDKLSEFLGEFPGWIREDLCDVRVIPGSQLHFVPKDAKTDRPICIEPLLNGLYQKGVGTYMRHRLGRFGVNLNDQGVNQKLASRALVDGLATVDFSSASDTIAYWLVLELLPFDWVEFLDVARSPCFEHEGRWYPFQKFTSMGNAYTFELETLIFYALATACCEELDHRYQTGVDLHVYGDDVIIPTAVFDLFSEVAECCGFEVNLAKSFSDGLFRESCGHDYFDGHLVRPFLLKRRLSTASDLFYACNIIRRFDARFAVALRPGSDPRGDYRRRRDRFRDLWRFVVGEIPPASRLWGPEGYGEGHIVCEFDETVAKRAAGRFSSWDGWVFRTVVDSAVRVPIAVAPEGYALYFARGRNPALISDDPVMGPYGDWLLRRMASAMPRDAEPLDNGSAYTVRSRTKRRVREVFCHFEWLGPYSALGVLPVHSDSQ